VSAVVQNPGPWQEGTWPAAAATKRITLGKKIAAPGAPTALAKTPPLGIPIWIWVLGSLGLIAVVWYVTTKKTGGRAWKSRRPF
jgi:hypothetical protein